MRGRKACVPISILRARTICDLYAAVITLAVANLAIKVLLLKAGKEDIMKRKIATAIMLTLTSIWALAGCHTVKGVGQDMQSGGKAIENSSGR